MLKKVRAGEELDLKKLSSFLVSNGMADDVNTPIELMQYSNGYSNLTYFLQVGNKEYVLRRPPLGAIKRGHDMGREYKVLSNLSKHFDKAPKTFAYEKTGEVIGSTFYLMEKVDGVVINFVEAKNRDLQADDFKLISETWMDAFVEFHNLDYREVGLEDLGRPEGYVDRQVSNWSKQYFKAATQEIEAASFVTKWMEENKPSQYDHTLVHNDFKYDNIMFEDGNWKQINAILDWEMCTLGDPMMDLGTSLGYWTTQNDGPVFSNTIKSPTMFPGNPTRTEVVQAYALKSGRNVDNLVFYYVFGLFKIAVIVQQIYWRYAKGLTTDPKFAQLDEVCKFLCKTARQSIIKKRIDNLY